MALAAGAQQVFRTAAELVAVDVTVLDSKGRPVSDLRAEEFEIKVDGRPRRVASAQFLRHAGPPEPGASREAAGPAPAPFSTNAGVPPGRLIVLVPDTGNLSVAGGRAAAEAGRRFLDRLGPEDRVGLFTLPVGPRVDFTADHAKLKEALGRVQGGNLERVRGLRYVSLAEAFSFVGRKERGLWSAAISRECTYARLERDVQNCVAEMETEARQIYHTAKATTGASVGALRALMGGLGRIEGPKTVVLISQGLVTGGSMGEPGSDRDLAPVADDAAAARVTLHTILIDRAFLEQMQASERWMPQTLTQDQRLLADGLEAVTGYAGGELHRVMVLADPGFERIAQETSGTWLLGFEPEPEDRDGKVHGIGVKVRREGVQVRSRPRFVAVAAPAPLMAVDRARRALEAPLPETALPISVAAHALGERGGEGVDLLVAAELGASAEAAAEVAVAYRLLDENGTVAAGSAATGGLRPFLSAAGSALYFTASVTLRPGTYTLKLAAADPRADRVGSVERQVEARLRPMGPVRFSDILIAPVVAEGAMLSVDGRLRPGPVRAYVEVHAAEAPHPPQVRFDFAEALDAPPRLRADATVQPGADPGRFAAEALMDVSLLPPGPYLLRAIVLRDGAEAAQVARPVEVLARGLP